MKFARPTAPQRIAQALARIVRLAGRNALPLWRRPEARRSGAGWLLGCLLLAATLAAGAPLSPAVAGAEMRASQHDLEAVYVYNFAKFVRWPANNGPDGVMDICAAGAPKSFGDSLRRAVSGESLNGRTLRVRTVERTGELSGCDILFVDSSLRNGDALLDAVTGKPVLTIGDGGSFLDRGGMIQFVVQESRVRFSVNLTPLSRSGLNVSSELLKVAVHVQGKASAGGAQ